ncbi:hypothetical protein BDQ12DRAFT_376267 [Crucibulum laeve]|uniref:F-box domain-containing protein n=1 Tax=Crucibulum laeve TaxID=68775 RepID=A0A5C3LPD3_9AGAR|nr:hypothetical protein BDQ12DRAFT_376267 [Crucibulum laeve]
MDIYRKCPNCNYVQPEKAIRPFPDISYSSFSHFTRQGIVPDPSSAEYGAIFNDISSGKDRMTFIEEKILDAEDEICRLQEVINQLQQERERMKHDVFRRESIFAPVRRLPADILGRIFCMVGTVTEWRDYRLPLVPPVSHVCYFWRSVSVELSELWSNITISHDLTSWVIPHRAVMETFITRSKGRPLSFALTEFDRLSQSDSGFHSIVDFIVSHSRRWKHIALKIRAGAHELFIPARDAVPLLESVSLIGNRCRQDLIDWFKNAPALRSLRLEDVPLSSIRCPWNQIRVLHLRHDYSIPSLYATLIQTSNLQELHIYLNAYGQRRLQIESHQMVELQHLKKLSVRSDFAENVGPILSMISTTSLEELIVSVDNNKEIINCVISVINRSTASKSLTVVLGNNEGIIEALSRILLEISGAETKLQFNLHNWAVDFVKDFAAKTSLPGGTRISNPFRIRSLGYQETTEKLVPTLENPSLFIGKGFAFRNYPQYWAKLSFQRFLGSSQVHDRKLCEGEIQLLNFK